MPGATSWSLGNSTHGHKEGMLSLTMAMSSEEHWPEHTAADWLSHPHHVSKTFAANKRCPTGSDDNDSISDILASPLQCLFCSQHFTADDEDSADDSLKANLEHMHISHGLFIPDPENLIEMHSFIEYLAVEVREWHECLYCGAIKSSTSGVQSHMRDKGHCRLNFEREPELLEFWERPRVLSGEDDDEFMSEQECGPTQLSTTEMRFVSGKVVGSRHAAPPARRVVRRLDHATSTRKALRDSCEDPRPSSAVTLAPQPARSRQLARRDQMSIFGVSLQTRQALLLAEKKAQRSEAVAHRAREWVYAKGANSQKYDQVDNQGKWGKQQHKLLPR